MRSPETFVDYFDDDADLEASLDLPVLGHLTWESRFHQLHDGLHGLAPDPRVSERLHQFVRSDAPVVWVVGLGDGGEEVPVAVGLAERAAAAGRQPVLFLGPERDRPRGLGAAGLRPIAAGPYAPVLAALYPEGCGAQASGIQGVLRVWPGSDGEAQPIEPGGVILVGRAAAEGLVPSPAQVTGTVLVAPYRDCPAQVITEEVTRLRSQGYPLLGLVAVSSRAVARRGWDNGEAVAQASEARAESEEGRGQGGTMKSAADDRDREGGGFFEEQDEVDGAARDLAPRSEDPEIDEPAGDDREFQAAGDRAPSGAEARPRPSWDEAFVPGRRPQPEAARARLPWWTWVLVLIALGTVAILASRLIGIEGGRPQTGPARPAPRQAAGGIAQTTEPVAVAPQAAVSEPSGAAAPQPPAAPMQEQAAVSEPSGAAAPPPQQQPEAVRAVGTRFEPPFALMCGSFRTAQRAQGEARRLAGLGLEARVVAVEIPGQGAWHRVIVGSWPDAAQAREAGRRALGAGWVKDVMLVSGNGHGSPMPGKLE